MALTGKREQFAHEYLKDLNATQAALRAGYAESGARVEGHRLLANEEVQDRIAELGADRAERLKLDADTVLIELLRVLTTDIADAFNADGTLKPIHAIPIDTRRAIAGFEVLELGSNAGVLKKVKLWSKDKAIELAARHLALLNDKLKVDGLDDLVQKIEEARARARVVPGSELL